MGCVELRFMLKHAYNVATMGANTFSLLQTVFVFVTGTSCCVCLVPHKHNTTFYCTLNCRTNLNEVARIKRESLSQIFAAFYAFLSIILCKKLEQTSRLFLSWACKKCQLHKKIHQLVCVIPRKVTQISS